MNGAQGSNTQQVRARTPALQPARTPALQVPRLKGPGNA